MKYYQKNNKFPINFNVSQNKIKYEEIQSKTKNLEMEFIDGTTNKFCGIAFISFEKVEDKEEILKAFHDKNDSNYNFTFFEQKVEIIKAKSPSDIFWENQRITEIERKKKRIISSFLTVGLLIISFLAIFFFTKVFIIIFH